jgi:hypothetical protein
VALHPCLRSETWGTRLFGWVKAGSGDADGSPGGWAQAFGEDCVEDFGYAFFDGFGVGVALDLGVERRLVGVADGGEVADLADEGAVIEAFGVAVDAGGERGVDVDFDEAAEPFSGFGAHGGVGRDGGDEGDDAAFDEAFGSQGDAADVLFAVLAAVTEAGADGLADFVSVEDCDGEACGAEIVCDDAAEGGLACSAEAGEPEGHSGRPFAVLFHFRQLHRLLRAHPLGA